MCSIVAIKQWFSNFAPEKFLSCLHSQNTLETGGLELNRGKEDPQRKIFLPEGRIGLLRQKQQLSSTPEQMPLNVFSQFSANEHFISSFFFSLYTIIFGWLGINGFLFVCLCFALFSKVKLLSQRELRL